MQGDSTLVIKQVNVEFALKGIALVTYRIAAYKLIKSFSSIWFDHVLRVHIERTDALAP